ncbi:NAD(P)/FAD-dependent oxidoreductase [Paraburkholderia sabiae]|uniref:NAD(P)/FAD-dependent oxidoreductase n=1 Tax=Paraburkholderia sabiae TaxID=273251 RepID=UPI001F3FE27D|nr:FAD-binding oxidoreductase [Paraburkholderia sabiae]WJZ79197.1 FAD-binding oxidoreductase [Paraburkholderia sabiae]
MPVYSGIVATEPLPADVAAGILPRRSVMYEHEDITVYCRIDAANRLLVGGRSRLKPMHSPGDFPDLQAYAKRLWPSIGNVRWSHGWNGQLAITRHGFPHFSEPADRVLVSVGYNGRGVAMATAMGGEIARRVTGTPSQELDMPVRAFHPVPFHSLWPLAVSARIAYGRARMRRG